MAITPNQAAVLRVIEETIEADEVMPTGARIATRSGVKITSVNSAIYQLVDQGVIEITNYGSGKRVVTIISTGAQTAHPDGARKVRLADVPSESFTVPDPVVPCWQCGTRSDIGCAHIRYGKTVSIGEATRNIVARMAVSA